MEIRALVENAGFMVVNHSSFSPYDNYMPHRCIGVEQDYLHKCLYRFNTVIRSARALGFDMLLSGDTHFLLSEKVQSPVNILYPELYHVIGGEQSIAFDALNYWRFYLQSQKCSSVA